MTEESQMPSNEGNPVVEDGGQATPTEVTYANGKFKSASDMEKSYLELESSFSKKLGGFKGSPEEYTLPEGVETNAFIDGLQTWGKESQLSQEGFEALLNNYSEYSKSQEEASQKAIEEFKASEIKKLGENADHRIKNATDWVSANLGQDGIDVLNNLGGAKGIEVVEKIMSMTKTPSPTDAPAKPAMTRDKINAMRYAKDDNGNRRMQVDPSYRAEVQGLMEEFIASGGKLS